MKKLSFSVQTSRYGTSLPSFLIKAGQVRTGAISIAFLLITANFFSPLFLRGVGGEAFSQNIGINTIGAIPNSSALLDIGGNVGGDNMGLLVPRVVLTATNSATPITTPATSLLVFNTATAGTSPNNVVPGYYFWNGTLWISLSGGSGGNDWGLLGNAGTTAGTNFLGTTDAVGLYFRTSNAIRMSILSGGNVGIGTTAPAGTIDVQGGTAAAGNGLNIIMLAQSGTSGGTDLGGNVNITAGPSGGTNLGGNVNIFGGTNTSGSNGIGGNVNIRGGFAAANSITNTSGSVNIFTAGPLAPNLGTSGAVNISTGASYLSAGNIVLAPGQSGAFGTYSNVIMNTAGGNVGIGTTAPNSKLQVAGGDVYTSTAGNGIILKSPDGLTCRRVSIDNTGAIVLIVVACP